VIPVLYIIFETLQEKLGSKKKLKASKGGAATAH
jgi:hypothetical protein